MSRPTRRALSLVELIIAIVILGLALPPLVIQVGNGVRQQAAALVQQTLTQLAAERIWEIATDHANPTRGYAYITEAAYPAESAPRGLAGYTRQTTIIEVSPADYVTPQVGSGIKRFRIVVTGLGNHSLTIESMVTNITGALGSAARDRHESRRQGRG
jgi:type II secretory pathway pseudopilin PulG